MGVKNFLAVTAKNMLQPFLSENAAIRNYYAKNYQRKIKKNTILYEVRDGQSIVDSPYAIFQYLINKDEFQDFHHIWVVTDLNYPLIQTIQKQYPDKVEFVVRNSKKYLNWLLTAEYLINNATFQSFFSKKEGQVYINTWHGTPLKYMGFDIPGDPSHSQNVLRNFLMTDFMLSPNPHTTKIFSESYRLNGIYSGTILEGGYPRIDNTFNSPADSVYEKLISVGLEIDPALPTILYTPTWKGSSIVNPLNDQQQIVQESLILKETFKDQYNFLIKVHPYIYESMREIPKIASILVPDSFDPNEVLAAVDLLVTDYSSIFFDFLVTDRPIVFYAWDRDLYDADRGMYFSESELPGPITENIHELIEAIRNINAESEKYQPVYQKMKEQICSYDDGNTTARYVARIFFGKKSQMITEHHLSSDKEKLLIYPGRMKNNGITTSFINLTNNLDYQNYDVSLLLARPVSDEEFQNLAKVNPNVRFLFRPGAPIYTRSEVFRNSWIQEFTLKKALRRFYPEKAYQREARRIIGGAAFDAAIDFSGYSFYWGKLISAMEARKKVVFQHNDLFTDSQKVINGKRPHEKSLPALFSIYYRFDRILSVSKETMLVNKEHLAQYVTPEQMGYTTNTIDLDKVLGKTHKETQVEQISLDNQRYLANVRQTGNYQIAKNLQSVCSRNFEERLITAESLIYVLAQFDDPITHNSYSKITINSVYAGWLATDLLIPQKVMEAKVTDLCQIATVTKTKGGYIYQDVHHLENIVSPLEYLERTYAFLSKKIVSDTGIFYFIENQNGPLGWVMEKYIANIHDLRGISVAKQLFYRRNRSELGITDSYQLVEKSGKLIDIPTAAWTEPPKTTFSEKIQLDFSAFLGQRAMISKEATAADKRYVFADFSGANAWVEAASFSDIEDVVSTDEPVRSDNDDLFTDIFGKEIAPIDTAYYNIVTMGRLSPEKNQEALIRGFAEVSENNPDIRLYILGDGDLKNDLLQVIYELEMQDKIFLLGHKEEPFKIMRQCDLFILSSVYEGQPMVLLEALTLGMPVIATDIPANQSVLGKQYGNYIHGTDAGSIARDLEKYLKEKPATKAFDPIAYNRKAIAMFDEEMKR
ncbi:CDP-glycerol glycerophosphotransferase family protein [Enterococcus mediterraneensis]|uniref:CDP-glycerol glycerophosphotransferase family protein n=1 Tax=Enterococcus mediterraneensis TaxID=2364791 RepID=UPI000F04FBB5|nr:CDP-glycerol glycerophosphotransferase family protein [Enterococcus mediterraneensis]